MITLNNGIQKPTCGYQNCSTNQILICSGYVDVRESWNTRVTIWVYTILDHIDMSPVLPKCDDSWTVYRHEWYAKQKYCQISMSCWDKNLWNPRHRYQMVSKKISYQSNTGLYPSQIINSMGGHLLQQQPLNRPWISLSHGQQLSFTNPKTAISESVWSWLKYKRHETVWNLLWKDANVHRKKKKCNTVIDFNSENMKTC